MSNTVKRTIEVHLGKPYAKASDRCIVCLAPATRTSNKIEGSLTVDGKKQRFSDMEGVAVCFCDEHGVIRREIESVSDEFFVADQPGLFEEDVPDDGLSSGGV